MVKINEEMTRKIAHLARIELSQNEVRTFTSQLTDVLAYIEELQSVDVDGVDPLTHPFDSSANPTPYREDRARPSPKNAQGEPLVLDSAPEALDGGFKVPPIL